MNTRPHPVREKVEAILTFNQADLIIPQEVFELLQEVLNNKPAPQFKRVVMSLTDIVEAEFLGKYIKSGMSYTP